MSHISLGVSRASKNYPKGAFTAHHYISGSSKRSKTVSLHVTSKQDAYEIVDLWAEDKSKEFDIQYTPIPFKEMCERLEGSNNNDRTSLATKKVSSNLGNIKFFKLEIIRAFKEFGADKLRSSLKEAGKLVNDLERERIKVAKNSNKAKSDVAKAMYLTYVDTGVDTSVYCNDETIVNEFNILKKDSGNLI